MKASRSSASRCNICLDREDRILWDAVRRTLTPMHGEHIPFVDVDMVREFVHAVDKIAPSHSDTLEINQHPAGSTSTQLQAIDPTSHRRLAKGRTQIEARVDLHGLTQPKAHSLLQHFVQSAHARGLRHVLVITGKGTSPGSDGVLRQSVPHWLATSPFRLYVAAYEEAARHHGGHGALYLRLRRHSSGERT